MGRLTGRIEFRRTLFGRIVLRVEEECSSRWAFWRRTPVWLRFRDASILDLTKVELRSLVDMRTRIRVPAVATMGASPAVVVAQPAPAPANGRTAPIVMGPISVEPQSGALAS